MREFLVERMAKSPSPTPSVPAPSRGGSGPTLVRERDPSPQTLSGTGPTLVRASGRPFLADHPPGPSGSLIGLKLGEYDVLSQLGAGGMGIVYRGVQQQIGKTVAIKVLKPEIATGTDSVQALLAEARAVNSIRHEGIVDIFSFGSTPDGRPYIVMELLEGESLDAVLGALGRFQPLEAIDLLEQMLSALDAAHSAGVIHRDLKPANLHLAQLKDGTWRVKILDFGLAKLTAPGASSTPQTQANVVRGTPEYMSPEQARAQDVSPRTDLYAIGVVAFELLTGVLPFKASNPVELLMQHISAPPPSPSSLEASVPPAFEAIILQMLAKDPADRPESALAVRRELLKIKKQLIEGGTQIRAAPLGPRPAKATLVTEVPTASKPRRSSTGLFIGLGVVVVALLAAALALLPPRNPQPVVVPVVARPEVVIPSEPVVEPVTEPTVKVDVPPVVAIKVGPAVKKTDRLRPRLKHTAGDVTKLLAELDADANTRPPGEARSRKRALQDFREELQAGGNPEELFRQLKDYQRSSR